MKDWTGNKSSAYAQLGASNHSETERAQNDFYATDPQSLEIFLKALKRDGIKFHSAGIWECACGNGNLSKVLIRHGFHVFSSDLIDRGYGYGDTDFLKQDHNGNVYRDILTNPPYKYAKEFVENALKYVAKIVM